MAAKQAASAKARSQRRRNTKKKKEEEEPSEMVMEGVEMTRDVMKKFEK